jgi:hypothetical protein
MKLSQDFHSGVAGNCVITGKDKTKDPALNGSKKGLYKFLIFIAC